MVCKSSSDNLNPSPHGRTVSALRLEYVYHYAPQHCLFSPLQMQQRLLVSHVLLSTDALNQVIYQRLDNPMARKA